MEAPYEEALRAIEETFGDRLKRSTTGEGEPLDGALASVLPMNAKEVEFLAEVAGRYSIPLFALGAETGVVQANGPQERSILVRFDLMRRTRFPEDPEEPWVETEPGAIWLELDDDLHVRGRGLAVYPTSAPRATVGGWLAMDGLGVGSFEYGWLRENVLMADVVLLGGERREVQGEELHSFVGPGGRAGIIVGARLRTRRSEGDLPFGFAFEDREDLIASVAELVRAGVPLWHLAFLNREMAGARGLGDDHLLFGAYPGERAGEVVEGLQDVLGHYRRRLLTPAELYRVWGERFFPVKPSHPTPQPASRELIPLAKLPEALSDTQNLPEYAAIQGTVTRLGEVLLLTFDARKEGWLQ